MNYNVFINNKYTKWYFSIIETAKMRKTLPRHLVERHHILPKSIFPQYQNFVLYPENGVYLTFREHYICHWLLTKMVNEEHLYKMSNALLRMTKKTNNRYRPKSIIYSNTRSKIRQSISGKNSPHFGVPKNYPNGNKGVPMKEETKEKLRMANLGKKASIETKNKMSNSHKGAKNPKFNGFYHTPWGTFESANLASSNTVSSWMIKTWCSNPTTVISDHHVAKCKFLSTELVGLTFKDLGFFKSNI